MSRYSVNSLVAYAVLIVAGACSETATAMSITDTVVVGDKEWAQVNLFTDLSWNDVNSVCPAGACSGTLNGFDVDNWIWAAIEQVGSLFSLVTPHPGSIVRLSQNNSTWAPAFFDSLGFEWIMTIAEPRGIFGMTRSVRAGSGVPYSAGVRDYALLGSPADSVTTNGFVFSKDLSDPTIGAWLFREVSTPSAVPVPSMTPVLFLCLIFLWRLGSSSLPRNNCRNTK